MFVGNTPDEVPIEFDSKAWSKHDSNFCINPLRIPNLNRMIPVPICTYRWKLNERGGVLGILQLGILIQFRRSVFSRLPTMDGLQQTLIRRRTHPKSICHGSALIDRPRFPTPVSSYTRAQSKLYNRDTSGLGNSGFEKCTKIWAGFRIKIFTRGTGKVVHDKHA